MKEKKQNLQELQAELKQWESKHPTNSISAMARTAKIESLTKKIKKITESEYLFKKDNGISHR